MKRLDSDMTPTPHLKKFQNRSRIFLDGFPYHYVRMMRIVSQKIHYSMSSYAFKANNVPKWPFEASVMAITSFFGIMDMVKNTPSLVHMAFFVSVLVFSHQRHQEV